MKKIRCPYFELNDLERAYHDKEWGTPCRNDRKLFEYLMCEVQQRCTCSFPSLPRCTALTNGPLSKDSAFLIGRTQL